MKEIIVKITTDDTDKTIEFNGKANPNAPELWFLDIRAHIVSSDTGSHSSTECYHNGHYLGGIYVERQTLVNVGKLPQSYQDQEPKKEETAESLFIRLLGKLGVRFQD